MSGCEMGGRTKRARPVPDTEGRGFADEEIRVSVVDVGGRDWVRDIYDAPITHAHHPYSS